VEDAAHRAADRALRDSYGRLMAFLGARTRDVAAAEDALAEAFRNALESWPVEGVPRQPEAWLLTAARRRLIDQRRHARVHDDAAPSLRAVAEEAQELAQGNSASPTIG
jgi:predicted RNA polymerase sigma factor